MKYIKSILGVAFSNIVNFGTSFLIGFILPAVLSVSEYGKYKEFILYGSFAYVFNLGFNDGIYIKYGGKSLKDIDKQLINNERNFILTFQIVILLFTLILGQINDNEIIISYGVLVFFINMVTFHQNFIQATGNFSLFTKANIFKSFIYVILLIITLLVFKLEYYQPYILLYIFSYIILYIIFEVYFFKNITGVFNVSIDGKIDLFKIGIFILFANVAQTAVGNIGNWVVNWNYDIEQFAYYSFQNSLLNVVLLIVNAVGMVLYNFLSKNRNSSFLILIKNICIILGIISGLLFFVFKFVINNFLPDYVHSISMLSITFIAIPYIMVTKILIVNLYKVQRTEVKYFKDSIVFCLLSFIIVFSTDFINTDVLVVAIATTSCYILWFLYCTNIEFKELKITLKDFGLLCSHIIVFYFCANNLSVFTGFFAYSIYLVVVLFLKRSLILDIKQVLRLGR